VISIRWLLKALHDGGLFRRNRFSLEVKVRAVLLYMAGLRNAAAAQLLKTNNS